MGQSSQRPEVIIVGGYRIVAPYHTVNNVYAKERWVGKGLLDVFEQEFSMRYSRQYYETILRKGCITVNDNQVLPTYTLRVNDLIKQKTHKHEPAVPNVIPQIIYDDKRGLLVIDKPADIPTHPTSLYYFNSITAILEEHLGLEFISNINRLDRETSGILVIAYEKERSRQLHLKMRGGNIEKTYVAKVKGEFPEEEIVCEEPILRLNGKISISVCSEGGKPSKTIFNRIKTIHENGKTYSLVYCKPITGRTHQIRTHLMHLGHPIHNDTIYGSPVWKDIENKNFIKEAIIQEIKGHNIHYEDNNRKISEHHQYPKWFDQGCIDCRQQYWRSFENPHIPLEFPTSPVRSLEEHMCLHALRYEIDDMLFETHLPRWFS